MLAHGTLDEPSHTESVGTILMAQIGNDGPVRQNVMDEAGEMMGLPVLDDLVISEGGTPGRRSAICCNSPRQEGKNPRKGYYSSPIYAESEDERPKKDQGVLQLNLLQLQCLLIHDINHPIFRYYDSQALGCFQRLVDVAASRVVASSSGRIPN